MEEKKKVDAHVLWTLFKTCFIISSCTFGGGPVVISMIQKKFVEELRWVEQNEAMDLIAIAQSCPGVMAVNTSIIIGYRIAGPMGALATALGTITPPMIILTVISAFYVQFRSNTVIALILRGMQAGVAAVMINVTITFVRNVFADKDILNILMLIGAAVAAIVFNVDIILIIIVCGLISAIFALTKRENAGAAKAGGAK